MPLYFWCLIGTFAVCTFAFKRDRRNALSRSPADWGIDIVNLVIHLWGLPLLQVAVLFKIYGWVMPGYRGSLEAGFLSSLLLYVALDYLWYWNHRLLHSYTWIWNLHAVHHSAKQVDVFTTARNSIWSHFAEVYLWVISLSVFLLKDSSWFLGFAAFGSVLNFWCHTRYTFARDSRMYHWLSKALILPQEHLCGITALTRRLRTLGLYSASGIACTASITLRASCHKATVITTFPARFANWPFQCQFPKILHTCAPAG